MFKILSASIAFIIANTPLWALDLNETVTIINEAEEATKQLQDDFETILNDVPTPEKESMELNVSSEPIAKEVITVIEVNERNQTKTSNHTEEAQATTPLLESVETNETSETNETNCTLDLSQPLPLLTNTEVNQTEEINKTNKVNEPIKLLNTITDEHNNTIESNASIEVVNKVKLNEDNQVIDINESSCDEENNSSQTDEHNISAEEQSNCDEIQGDSMRGLILYKTRIKPFCEMTGEKFAKQYMQEDWDDIYHDKEFKMEVIKACPQIEKRYKDSWTPHLYQFALEYASDSDAIPEC